MTDRAFDVRIIELLLMHGAKVSEVPHLATLSNPLCVNGLRRSFAECQSDGAF